MKPIPKPSIVVVLEELGGRVVSPDRGGWRKAECPLHEDRTPSASVNEDVCRFKCHSCGFSGDAVDLIMESSGVGFNAAIARAEELAGEGGGEVRGGGGQSSLLPRTTGHRPGRRSPGPTWQGFGS